MRLPALQGLIRRRLLINFRADPAIIAALLPKPLRPKRHGDFALVGICLIRLEAIRPDGWPAWCGLSSENAAHRIAVEWDGPQGPAEGVYIPRRHTSSWLNHRAGGVLFPGEQKRAAFKVADSAGQISLDLRSADGETQVRLETREADQLPTGSCFATLAASSAFFQAGSTGYSATTGGRKADGLRLDAERWQFRPLEVASVRSSFFEETAAFPAGSLAFDHALIMRDIPHRWHAVPDLALGAQGRTVA